jgi:hypothetical protein
MDYLAAAIAILALCVAWGQWRMEQNRLRLELFDRRSKVYEAARDYLKAARQGTLTFQSEFTYLSSIQAAIWLFDNDPRIMRFLHQELWRKVTDLDMLESELKGLDRGDARSENIKAQRAIKDWLDDQRSAMEEMFAPYLRLSHTALSINTLKSWAHTISDWWKRRDSAP